MSAYGIRGLETGRTMYAVLVDLRDARKYYNAATSAFEAMATANWTSAKYCRALTETPAGGYEYQGTLPTLAAGLYEIQFYRQAGASPALTDPLMAVAAVSWTGTAMARWADGAETVKADAVAISGDEAAADNAKDHFAAGLLHPAAEM